MIRNLFFSEGNQCWPPFLPTVYTVQAVRPTRLAAERKHQLHVLTCLSGAAAASTTSIWDVWPDSWMSLKTRANCRQLNSTQLTVNSTPCQLNSPSTQLTINSTHSTHRQLNSPSTQLTQLNTHTHTLNQCQLNSTLNQSLNYKSLNPWYRSITKTSIDYRTRLKHRNIALQYLS